MSFPGLMLSAELELVLSFFDCFAFLGLLDGLLAAVGVALLVLLGGEASWRARAEVGEIATSFFPGSIESAEGCTMATTPGNCTEDAPETLDLTD